MNIFLQGLTMGLAYVAPIGMQNLFVINSALTNKRKRALLTALIVIFFDITLSLACFFGIGTIMQAKKILIIVSGEDKADIVRDAFFGPVTPRVPASILQMHSDVTLVADEAALSKIPRYKSVGTFIRKYKKNINNITKI